VKKEPKIVLTIDFHRKNEVLLMRFPINNNLIERVKKIGSFWSATKKAWYLRYTKDNLKAIYAAFQDHAIIDDSALKSENDLTFNFNKASIKKQRGRVLPEDLHGQDIVQLHKFVKYLRGKSLSESTVRTYYTHILDLLKYLNGKPTEEISNRDIETFIEDVCIPRKYAISTLRQVMGAMKHFKTLFTECLIDETRLEMPRKSRILPTVLSKEEVVALLRSTKNLKHRAVLAMIYASGLRIGELIHLELRDIDVRRFQIFVRNSKGRKDRYVIMAKSLMPLLNNYMATYKPVKYFVEGMEPGIQYTAGSVRNFLRKSCFEAGIKKKVTPHTLRHCYATHLLENGVDIRYIQELLGHSKPETTMIYTHVATKDLLAIESPLDKIVKELSNASDKQDPKLTLSGKFNLS
jgi:site-specific recombinase XerD